MQLRDRSQLPTIDPNSICSIRPSAKKMGLSGFLMIRMFGGFGPPSLATPALGMSGVKQISVPGVGVMGFSDFTTGPPAGDAPPQIRRLPALAFLAVNGQTHSPTE
jgi:hypothetical protein